MAVHVRGCPYAGRTRYGHCSYCDRQTTRGSNQGSSETSGDFFYSSDETTTETEDAPTSDADGGDSD